MSPVKSIDDFILECMSLNSQMFKQAELRCVLKASFTMVFSFTQWSSVWVGKLWFLVHSWVLASTFSVTTFRQIFSWLTPSSTGCPQIPPSQWRLSQSHYWKLQLSYHLCSQFFFFFFLVQINFIVFYNFYFYFILLYNTVLVFCFIFPIALPIF